MNKKEKAVEMQVFDMKELEERYQKKYVVDPLYTASRENVNVNDYDKYLNFLIESVGTQEEKESRRKQCNKKKTVSLMEIKPIPEGETIQKIADRFRCWPSELHKRYEEQMVDEWKNHPDRFFQWVLKQMEEQPGDKLRVIHKGMPMGPDNCRITTVQGHTEQDPLIKKAIEMAAPFRFNPYNKYRTLVRLGEVDPDKWTMQAFCRWTIAHIKKGEIAPYLNRLDISKPYSPTNCYFSFRPRNGRSHGMSKTHLYSKWTYFSGHYKELLTSPVSLQDFMDYALGEGGYQLKCGIKVKKTGLKMTVRNIRFLSVDDYTHINRIMSVYRDIPIEQNGFRNPKEFIAWTIQSGYSEWMDFKKVGRGKYSEKTCVWDIFTEEAYVASRGRRTYKIYKKAANGTIA